LIPLSLGCLLLTACVQSYTPPTITTGQGILVVDGFINAGNDSTRIFLSRTVPLSATPVIKPESSATLSIEGNDQSRLSLQELSPGVYGCPPFAANGNVKYRLDIQTSDGHQYQSDFLPVLFSPPIDSVNWVRNDSGNVVIYVNTHDALDGARFYRWAFTETWEFHPIYKSLVSFGNGIFSPRNNYLDIYTCWHTEQSTHLLLGSSSLLSSNLIYHQPIEEIDNNSRKLSVDYSILVQQVALDGPTYAFFENLQQSTEKSGTLFDPQPATLKGNIHSLQPAKETVLGEIYCSSSTEKRIFINNDALSNWYVHLPLANDSCEKFKFSVEDIGSVQSGSLIMLDDTTVTDRACADCTVDGTNIMPPYWH
jgi:hypothetical protein